MLKKIFLISLVVLLGFQTVVGTAHSDALSDNLKLQAQLKQKIANAQNQAKTLSSQIAAMNDQMELTKLQIEETTNRLDSLNQDIAVTTSKLADATGAYDNMVQVKNIRVVKIYKESYIGGLEVLLGSSSLSDLLLKQKYADSVHQSDVGLMRQLKASQDTVAATKADLENQKAQQEALKASLVSKQNYLENQKKQQSNLLAVTQNNEANYQTQLAAAKAEEAALRAFVRSVVGSGGSILAHVDLADSWGKYYNQRDSWWGNIYINQYGSGPHDNSGEQIWDVGCLVTSVAMVYSHYGYNNITPAAVGVNPNNFLGYTAYMLIPGPVPPGHSATYINSPSLGYLRDQISTGHAVILGMKWGGNQHWVVARGVDGAGNFMINDPAYNKAMNVPLTSHYSPSYIFAARVYN